MAGRKRSSATLLLLSFCFGCSPVRTAPHPLTPLTADEITEAAKLIKDSEATPRSARFSQIALDEPAKELVLRDAATQRRALAVIYDYASNRTWEAVANLTTQKMDGLREIPGAQPGISSQDSDLADEIMRADPRFERAMAARGIRDLNRVAVMAWSAGYFALPGTEEGRIVRAVPYDAGYGSNFYAHPDRGRGGAREPHHPQDDRPGGYRPQCAGLTRRISICPRQPPAFCAPLPRLCISRSRAARAFDIVDGEVRWQKWHFRYGMHPREGVVLYTVGYEDGGKVRPVMYRGSLSEMVVPYGDPGAGWYFRNSFDVGELGLGAMASPLRRGVDCPENCSLFDAVVADESGEPHRIPGAIAIFERDAGILWKHADNTRRSRELVVSYFSQPGNYEYGFDWIFHQDGTLEMRVSLTGIMAAKGVADGVHEPYSHLVAKNLAAPHHQHFFTFRLDLDVDGTANRVVEMNSAPMPAGPENPYGGGFIMTETPLLREADAQRNLNLESSRRWIVTNPDAKNALGHPTGFALLPGENAVPFALPDSWVRKRAGFLNAHIWATPYADAERYAAGDYPNQSRGGDGLPKWTAANRSIDNQDVVLWYTMGITHNPRPEDWPVMPVHAAGFKLVPWGFFSSNPALDIPPIR